MKGDPESRRNLGEWDVYANELPATCAQFAVAIFERRVLIEPIKTRFALYRREIPRETGSPCQQ